MRIRSIEWPQCFGNVASAFTQWHHTETRSTLPKRLTRCRSVCNTDKICGNTFGFAKINIKVDVSHLITKSTSVNYVEFIFPLLVNIQINRCKETLDYFTSNKKAYFQIDFIWLDVCLLLEQTYFRNTELTI
jgi:hypothetical protein